MTDLKITQVRSVVGMPQQTRETLRALGLMRLNDSVVVEMRSKVEKILRELDGVVDIQVATTSSLLEAPMRIDVLIGVFGSGTALAKVLGVRRRQPSRWRTGEECPSPGMARLVADLDYVMVLAQMLYPKDVARVWLSSSNSYLDGARPIDVLRDRGESEVVDALDTDAAGAFA